MQGAHRFVEREAGSEALRVSAVFCDGQKGAELVQLPHHFYLALLLYLHRILLGFPQHSSS